MTEGHRDNLGFGACRRGQCIFKVIPNVSENMARRHRKKSLLRRLGTWALIAVLAVLLLSMLLTLPLRWVDPMTTAFMLQDDSGRVPVMFEWRDWDSIGSTVALAVVAAEDQRFAEHWGIDLKSVKDALERASGGSRLRGASTITQQLAKNLYLWPGRSLVRKGLEAWLALNLELFLPKKRILEIYLNTVELGPGVYGFPAASRFYFGKSPTALTNREAALLAAVLPNPHRFRADRPTAYVGERQAWILRQLRRLQRERWLALIDP
jgi:monofunctional biosynthetic peptidoglycan transglycosylase